MHRMDLQGLVTEKFLRYVSVNTRSDESSGTHPSSVCQFDLARILVRELQDLGADEVFFDEEHCYIYSKIKASGVSDATGDSGGAEASGSAGASGAALPKIGFIAHMDTSPEASGENIRPQVIADYDGGEIRLSEDRVLRPSEFPELSAYVGQTIITSDGTTLLGSDDKSGIAEIMTMVEYFLSHTEIPHGEICIAFTPDEEIGEGTEFFDIERFGADFAYTVDGGELGELSYENFNAASANIKVIGRNVHPGEAFGKMINASRLAMEIDSLLSADERPEKTRDRQGFYHLTDMQGDANEASIKYIIRDHDLELFTKKKETVAEVCREVQARYPGARVEAEIKDSYYNMLEKIKPRFEIVERAASAMRRCGVEPKFEPIRGGTDGAMLSYKGLLCPNLCAGGHNFHGVYEYVSCESMARITEILIEIARGE